MTKKRFWFEAKAGDPNFVAFTFCIVAKDEKEARKIMNNPASKEQGRQELIKFLQNPANRKGYRGSQIFKVEDIS